MKIVLIITPIIIAMILWSASLLLPSFDRFETKLTDHGKFSCAVFYKKGSPEEFICHIKKGETFDLTEDYTFDPDNCKIPLWGGCGTKDVSYDKKYVQEVEDKHSGGGCNITVTYRFKVIKRGYTEINVDSVCNSYDEKYRILIY